MDTDKCKLFRFDAEGVLGSNRGDIAIYPVTAFEIQESDKEKETLQAGKRNILKRQVVYKTKSRGQIVWVLLI